MTRLSASHQVGEPSSSPIYVVTTANRHFFLSVSGRSVWAAKLWPRISALQVRGAGVSRENLHTLTRWYFPRKTCIADLVALVEPPKRNDNGDRTDAKKWQVQRFIHIGQRQETHFLRLVETAISYKPNRSAICNPH